MATAESLAIRTETALQSLADSASRLSASFQIAPLSLPDRARGDELNVLRVEAVARFLADLSDQLTEEPMKTSPVNYHLMSAPDLLKLVTERGLFQPESPGHDDMVQMLLDHDAAQVAAAAVEPKKAATSTVPHGKPRVGKKV